MQTRGTESSLLAEPRLANPGTVGKQNGFCFKPPNLGLLCYTAIDNIYTDLNSNVTSALANCVTVGIYIYISIYLYLYLSIYIYFGPFLHM